MTCPFSWRVTESADQRFQLPGSASSSVAPRTAGTSGAATPARRCGPRRLTLEPRCLPLNDDAQRRPQQCRWSAPPAPARRRTPQPARSQRPARHVPRPARSASGSARGHAARPQVDPPAPGLRPDAPYRDLRPYGLLARATPKCCISRATRSPWVSGTMWPPLGSVTKGASARHQSSGAIRSCGPRRI